jgi:DNA-binding transcriptional ArsR family regulator
VDSDELLALLAAVGHPQRLRVIAELATGRQYVSELARRLEISRPLLYMHLDRLEKVGLVVGSLNASEEGKALKYFELVPFELNLNTDLILGVVQADDAWAEASTSLADAQNVSRIPAPVSDDAPGPGTRLDGSGAAPGGRLAEPVRPQLSPDA